MDGLSRDDVLETLAKLAEYSIALDAEGGHGPGEMDVEATRTGQGAGILEVAVRQPLLPEARYRWLLTPMGLEPAPLVTPPATVDVAEGSWG